MSHDPIRVLVVDDSAFVRKVVTQMLRRSTSIEVVGAARDGSEALEMVRDLEPDVVTLDLMMPVLDGIGFLREQMSRRPVPVVICSIAHDSGVAAMEALDAGAVEFVQKPTALATEKVYEIADELIEKVHAAANVRMERAAPRPPEPALARPARKRSASAGTDLVVIGISTGGPQALRSLIPRLPADFPVPVTVVLHMPVGYTEMYAQRLNSISAVHVVEAKDGVPLAPGTVYIAPAGLHLSFVRDVAGVVRTHLDAKPSDTPHRPAVDVLFKSAAQVFNTGVLGIIMTGMGDDGLLGAAHIKERGGRITTEAEESCVVYGMPRVVFEAGLSDHTATLDDMADLILELV